MQAEQISTNITERNMSDGCTDEEFIVQPNGALLKLYNGMRF